MIEHTPKPDIPYRILLAEAAKVYIGNPFLEEVLDLTSEGNVHDLKVTSQQMMQQQADLERPNEPLYVFSLEHEARMNAIYELEDAVKGGDAHHMLATYRNYLHSNPFGEYCLDKSRMKYLKEKIHKRVDKFRYELFEDARVEHDWDNREFLVDEMYKVSNFLKDPLDDRFFEIIYGDF